MSDWDFLYELEGQELEDAMTTGATAEEWAYIAAREREEEAERPQQANINKKRKKK